MRVSEEYIYGISKGFYYISLTIPILTFMFVCVVTYKNLTYKSKVDTYEEYFTIIEYKESNTVDLEYESDLVANKYKDIEVNEYINCLNKELSEEEFDDNMRLTIRTLNNLFNSSYN